MGDGLRQQQQAFGQTELRKIRDAAGGQNRTARIEAGLKGKLTIENRTGFREQNIELARDTALAQRTSQARTDHSSTDYYEVIMLAVCLRHAGPLLCRNFQAAAINVSIS